MNILIVRLFSTAVLTEAFGAKLTNVKIIGEMITSITCQAVMKIAALFSSEAFISITTDFWMSFAAILFPSCSLFFVDLADYIRVEKLTIWGFSAISFIIIFALFSKSCILHIAFAY